MYKSLQNMSCCSVLVYALKKKKGKKERKGISPVEVLSVEYPQRGPGEFWRL